jgi:uncharacterized protein YyaL (SSP411 family)
MTQHTEPNSLAQAASAYLRSAMHQPIRWHEWGEEAFATAQRENKPILLDIGAVWCHWCHVMDRESYENPEVAQIVNERFVAVKVDRDERPDVDSRYQAAMQAISGQGGWPLTAFLTPDGKPFYGGTYFPPEDTYGRPGLKRVLIGVSQAFQEKREDVIESAANVMSAISQAETFRGMSADVRANIPDHIAASAKRQFDAENGGFGDAPKFPHPAAITVLIDSFVRANDEIARNVFTVTLEKMARGGVYDQLAGGFHRYSVDEYWVVPHFEKMSYDNSELLKCYVDAYQATGNEFFASVAKDIMRWMDEWLSDRERGGFYASQDADYSLDDDGDYFTWTLKEAQAVLSADELRVAALHYDIGETGEMHHNHFKNVLYQRVPLEEVANRLSMAVEDAQRLLESAKQKMYAERLKRPTPYVDKTMYVAWNALCVSAYLKAARVLGLTEARKFALKSLDRILAEGWNAEMKRIAHVIAYAEPTSSPRAVFGMLDDYAATAVACLDAYEVTGDLTYFHFAQQMTDAVVARFYDGTGGGFFDAEEPVVALGALSARRKPFQDAPTPAGNSIAAIALVRLEGYTNEKSYRDKAEDTLELIGGVAEQFGIYAGTYGIAVAHLTRAHEQVIVIGNDAEADALEAAAARTFSLTGAVVRLRESEAVAQYLPPALAATVPSLPGAREGKSMAVVCSNFACQPPVTSVEELSRVRSRAA